MTISKVICPHCKQSFDPPEEMSGQTINCPHCQGAVKLPVAAAQVPGSPTPEYVEATIPSLQEEQALHPAAKPDGAPMTKVLTQLSSLLVPGETIEANAVQNQLFAGLRRPNIVLATTGRLIGVSRGFFGGFTPQDIRWQDVKEASIKVGVFGADLTIEALSSPDLASSSGEGMIVFRGLRKAGAEAVYRICQAEKQAWREKRRLREMEELRAKSGGIQLETSQPSPVSPQSEAEGGDAATRLQRAKDMLEKGLITDSEFETIKARIIGSL
jgi:hypothetical protein